MTARTMPRITRRPRPGISRRLAASRPARRPGAGQPGGRHGRALRARRWRPRRRRPAGRSALARPSGRPRGLGGRRRLRVAAGDRAPRAAPRHGGRQGRVRAGLPDRRRQDFAVRRIKALHELGTVDMLEDGGTRRLAEARELAHRAGAISTMTVIDFQLANGWSVGRPRPGARPPPGMRGGREPHRGHGGSRPAPSVSRRCRALRRARRRGTGRQAGGERAARRPRVAVCTWGQARVAASLLHDDHARALQESKGALSQARPGVTSPRRTWGFYALLQAAADEDGSGASRHQAAGAAVGWNRAYLLYAEAVVQGQDGHAGRATGWPRRPRHPRSAPWWNHLARRLVAPAALKDGWGQPVSWLREATAEFEASGHSGSPRPAAACCGRRASGCRGRVAATPRCRRRCAGSASPAARWMCSCSWRAASRTPRSRSGCSSRRNRRDAHCQPCRQDRADRTPRTRGARGAFCTFLSLMGDC